MIYFVREFFVSRASQPDPDISDVARLQNRKLNLLFTSNAVSNHGQ